MKRAKFGVIFFGMGLSMTRGKHMNSAGILNIAAEMNAFTKFVCMPMRGHGNVTGADVVLRWTTGYPFGINLSRGYPRFNPGEFSTVDVLVRGDNDATLVLGADPGATMPQPAIEHLTRTPTIVLDPKVTHTSRLARVHFTTAVSGVSAPGTAYRMDEIPMPLRPALKSPYPTDEEIVNLIIAAVAKKPGFRPAADRGDGGDRLDGNGSSSPAADSSALAATLEAGAFSWAPGPLFQRHADDRLPGHDVLSRSRESCDFSGVHLRRTNGPAETRRTVLMAGRVQSAW